MGLLAAVSGVARFDGVSRLPRAAIAALKPLDFHIYKHPETGAPEFSIPPGFRFHADALGLLRELRKGRKDLPNEFWRDKVNGARYCCIAERDRQLAAITWMYDYPAKRPMLVLAPGDAETSGTYVLPEFRGCRLSRSLSLFRNVWWFDSHHDGRVFTVAASDNPTSLWQIPRMGCVELAVVHRNSLFGPRFHTAQVPRHR
jgi:hypothetical protein